jgi:hypothetical protein
LFLAACATVMAVASVTVSAPQARAHERWQRSYATCVVAERGARLYPLYNDDCGDCCCQRPHPRWVRPGRAFRVERQEGGYLEVWTLGARGWIDSSCVHIAHEAFCRAAGI